MLQKEQMDVGQQYACMLYTWRSCSMPIGQVNCLITLCLYLSEFDQFLELCMHVKICLMFKIVVDGFSLHIVLF